MAGNLEDLAHATRLLARISPACHIRDEGAALVCYQRVELQSLWLVWPSGAKVGILATKSAPRVWVFAHAN